MRRAVKLLTTPTPDFDSTPVMKRPSFFLAILLLFFTAGPAAFAVDAVRSGRESRHVYDFGRIRTVADLSKQSVPTLHGDGDASIDVFRV